MKNMLYQTRATKVNHESNKTEDEKLKNRISQNALKKMSATMQAIDTRQTLQAVQT